jgi:hypothetical protein
MVKSITEGHAINLIELNDVVENSTEDFVRKGVDVHIMDGKVVDDTTVAGESIQVGVENQYRVFQS